MSDWIIKKSSDEVSYLIYQKHKIHIWFQEVKITKEDIRFYDRKVLIACYSRKMFTQDVINDLKTLPQMVN